ncbi:MAG: cbb3-type cytochrome c oxidase subunit I, partial [Candidatus Hydrogenedentes bacterium]|nr:cbb3-type cytochrome c oxidase subunit I [Candidatus Hydrogenedentota bacterium]
MAVTAVQEGASASEVRPEDNYLMWNHSIKSWLFTQDHKRIAILYLISIFVFFLLGGLFALLSRIELLTPAGDVFEADRYNKLFTLHGVIMIFFFLLPSVPATLGNFFVPIMIGARDLAFPKINLASWWVFNLAGVFA